MRRLLLIVLALAAAGTLAVVGTGADDTDGGKRYWVELDNAFGLIEGGDVKVAGVRAGKITEMKLDREDMRALIGIRVDRGGFGDLRTDVHCESRPQSLIGEYFLDCQPGARPTRLPEGATVPVEQTGTVVPLDLINNIMRRPYRERFSILFSEFGAALAARGGDLNEVIRRANPALRETDKVLRVLAEQKRVIRDLYRDADRVVGELARDREQVVRFVQEARDTASTSASRAEGVRRQWRTFPTFLRELRPTMARLGESADAQRPALENLNASADIMERFFRTLGPFAEASQPAFRTLAGAARAGRRAVRAARPNVAQLREAVDDLPEAAQNLAITLEHLHDPKFAHEKDERAGRGPDGGYTGFETLLRYFYAQSQAINLYDANNYLLKASVFYDRACVNYADAETVRNHSEHAKRTCRAWLGPTQPGVNTPDFTKTDANGESRSAKRGRRAARSGDDRVQSAAPGAQAPAPGAPAGRVAPRSGRGNVLDDARGIVQQVVPGAPAVPRAPSGRPTADRLLDYLLGP